MEAVAFLEAEDADVVAAVSGKAMGKFLLPLFTDHPTIKALSLSTIFTLFENSPSHANLLTTLELIANSFAEGATTKMILSAILDTIASPIIKSIPKLSISQLLLKAEELQALCVAVSRGLTGTSTVETLEAKAVAGKSVSYMNDTQNTD